MKDTELIRLYETASLGLSNLGFSVHHLNGDHFVVKKNDADRESFAVDTVAGLMFAMDALSCASSGCEVIDKLPDHLRLCRNAQAGKNRWRLYSAVYEKYVGIGAPTPEAAIQQYLDSKSGDE